MKVLINPGTEKQASHNEQNAVEVAEQICEELSISIDHLKRVVERDDGKGWYGFVFNGPGGSADVDIPGIKPEIVTRSKPFVSPRLYVNGSSWLYSYALSRIQESISYNNDY